MKVKSTILCAVVLLVVQTITSAQKTEVRVRKGTVIAETQTASVNIEEGRKAILSPDKNPTVTVDDPLVDDVMEIYKWVEAEKQAQRERIDASSIQVIRIENEHLSTIAYFAEIQNTGSEPSDTCLIGGVTILDEPKYYDLQGNLLQFELEKISVGRGSYTVHFPKPVGPGENFKYICVSKIISDQGLRKGGPLRHIHAAWNPANCLNYFRFILPESAIFVDSSRPVNVVDSVDGRVAVTIRSYTGQLRDGQYHIDFLWPDKDGTTLADIPPQYRGLRDLTELEVVEESRLEIAKILSGQTYKKQDTPLEALLSIYSAVAHKSPEDFLNLITPDLREDAASEMDQIMGFASGVVEYEFLGTPQKPTEPENGYKHPVYLCRKGSLICEATIIMVYQDGKWYLEDLSPGRKIIESAESSESVDSKVSGGVTISKGKPDLSAATYDGLKPGQFMRKWLFLGLIQIPWDGDTYFPDNEHSNKFFDTESLNLEQFEPRVRIAENDFEWSYLYSEYGVVDLTQVYDDWFVVAYAWAQIDMPEETHGVLGIGSDDSVKVWLNGKLVHKNLVTRGVIADNDRVPVAFKKGKNQLVLKILNTGGPWGFACRLLETR